MPEEETKSTEGTVVYSEIPIEWPRKVLILDTPDADDSGSESNNQLRSDSGVGESVRRVILATIIVENSI